MAKLILSMDGLVLKDITLTKERTTIGRKPHNDIQIDNLAVSGEHAVIVTILSDSFLEDLGSTNGTLVNGQPIKKHFLQNNDVIELGKYKLKYANEALAGAGKSADFEKTMVLNRQGTRPEVPAMQGFPGFPGVPGGLPQVPSGFGASQPLAGMQGLPGIPAGLSPAMSNDVSQPMAAGMDTLGLSTSGPLATIAAPSRLTAPQSIVNDGRAPTGVNPVLPTPFTRSNPQANVPSAPAQAPVGTRMGVIQILTGSNAGRELELTKPLTTLGKPQVQVAVITKRPNGYFITHVEGSTHPVVNGKTLDAQAHQLADHDIIEIAGVKMEFYLKG
jgi:pSer/pThr/pTyr-binding forkhead associated (FHA) protein